MYEEQHLISLGLPLDAAVTLCHTARREGILEALMREVNRDCDHKHKCSCNPPCAHCACKNR